MSRRRAPEDERLPQLALLAERLRRGLDREVRRVVEEVGEGEVGGGHRAGADVRGASRSDTPGVVQNEDRKSSSTRKVTAVPRRSRSARTPGVVALARDGSARPVAPDHVPAHAPRVQGARTPPPPPSSSSRLVESNRISRTRRRDEARCPLRSPPVDRRPVLPRRPRRTSRRAPPTCSCARTQSPGRRGRRTSSRRSSPRSRRPRRSRTSATFRPSSRCVLYAGSHTTAFGVVNADP